MWVFKAGAMSFPPPRGRYEVGRFSYWYELILSISSSNTKSSLGGLNDPYLSLRVRASAHALRSSTYPGFDANYG